ncbi:endonuclease 8-like 2 isoform X1 [Talpa occidentalis]|uniref:endonuclease 8-like 2 isoform X1 n=1 Tax=Talpa occidentalis TaxID=50954 RepID=UPI00188F6E0E|nr:endonuclease 8-like 2 isoform X1 [Talpa occidentalis]XP_037382450.1 endonuclease 8-like 2 isoform X1 [Talpa occidentalis]XP_037382451.1 endonuclease 8-like 2 isoform X1 [Talpa occidentalis]XP_037382452.1 endonuclease 8-like 2 isoform X1 [Talpa occidentalis]
MPEGPSVRRYHGLVSPFVGQQVVRTGGSSKKLDPASFQSLWLQDAQVHGKKLFLRFDPDEETGSSGGSPPPVPPHKRARKDEAGDQKPALGANGQQVSAQPSPTPPPPGPLGSAGAGDTELWLRVAFGLFGSVWVSEFSRAKKANKRGDWKDPIPRLVLHFGGGGFLAFYNCQMSWCSSPVVSPTSDILAPEFHRGRALVALGQAQPVCYTLLDQRHFSGSGNIIKNEALYRAGIHPLSLGSLLQPPQLQTLLDHVLGFSADWLQGKCQGRQQHMQIYQKEQCPEGHQVCKEAFGPPGGFQRLTWWCPQCQPRVPAEQPEQQRRPETLRPSVSPLALEGPRCPGGQEGV